MKKAIIFDLDQTLINSKEAERFRRPGYWPKAYNLIPTLPVYESIHELLNDLIYWNIPICIVTSSPEPYCSRIIKYHQWNITATVCFHDTKRRKPFPDPILLGLEKLGISSQEAISIGDDPKDIQASNAAGVYSVAALWGCSSTQDLVNEYPDSICESVEKLRNLIIDMYKIK